VMDRLQEPEADDGGRLTMMEEPKMSRIHGAVMDM